MIRQVTITDHRGTRLTHHLFERDSKGLARCSLCYLGFAFKGRKLGAKLRHHARGHWKQITGRDLAEAAPRTRGRK